MHKHQYSTSMHACIYLSMYHYVCMHVCLSASQQLTKQTNPFTLPTLFAAMHSLSGFLTTFLAYFSTDATCHWCINITCYHYTIIIGQCNYSCISISKPAVQLTLINEHYSVTCCITLIVLKYNTWSNFTTLYLSFQKLLNNNSCFVKEECHWALLT